jgi:hypothetical protein
MYANAFLNHLSARDGSSLSVYTKMDVLGLFLASGCFQMNGFHYIALLVYMQGMRREGGGVNIDVHLGTTALDLWET